MALLNWKDSRVLPFILPCHHCPAVPKIFAVRGRKSVSRGGAGNPPFLASNPDYRLMLKIYCNTQNQARRMGLPNSSKKVLHH